MKKNYISLKSKSFPFSQGCLLFLMACSFNVIAQTPVATTYPLLATCSASSTTDHVMVLADAPKESYNSSTYTTSTTGTGTLDGNNTVDEFMHPDWTAAQIGTIYFTEFDNDGSIYMPASRFTKSIIDGNAGLDMRGAIGNAYAAGIGGGINGRDVIYKTDPITGAPSGWAAIETNNMGFGGITYDPSTNTFYVVNMGDQSIYHLDASGNVIGTPYKPTLPLVSYDDGTYYGYYNTTNYQSHPFGLDIHPVNGDLYYTVIRSDLLMEVRSIGLGTGGAMTGADNQAATSQRVLHSEGMPVIADIDFNSNGDMAVGSFTTHQGSYYIDGLANTIRNHEAYVHIFEMSGGSYVQTAFTSVGQHEYFEGNDPQNRQGTATGGVAWNIDPALPAEILWMSGGDFQGEDDKWGVIGYNSNQLDNLHKIEDATDYIQFLFAPFAGDPTIDPKGNGGDVDIFYPGCDITLTLVSATQESCNDNGDGQIEIIGSSGDPSFSLEYSIDGGATWQTGTTFTSLTAGDYTITARDANQGAASCTENIMATLTVNTTCCSTCATYQEIFQTIAGTGYANTSSSGGATPANLSGMSDTAGSSADNSNSSLINGAITTATLVFDHTFIAGTVITLSLARNNTNGEVTISDGNVAGDIVFDSGTNDLLESVSFTLSQATNQITITRTAGSVWVNGASFTNSITSTGFTCIGGIDTDGLTNVTCNGINAISLDLNPTGTGIGTTYNVSVSGGTATSISPTSGTYGATTTFTLNDGSAGGSDVTITLTDADNNTCTRTVTITDPGACVVCTTPTISTRDTTICNGNMVDVSELVTTTNGALTFHSATPPDDSNVLASTMITPTMDSTIYVLATDNACTSTGSLTIMHTIPDSIKLCDNGSTSTTITAQGGLTGVEWFNSSNVSIGTGDAVTIDLNTAGMDDGTDSYYYTAQDGDGCAIGICCPIVVQTEVCAVYDWGDLPDTSATTNASDYQTTSANNGPAHAIISGLSLGSLIDEETDGQPSTNALGDDTDEDGLLIFVSLDISPRSTFRIPLSYTNTTAIDAQIEAWIDWNGDGDFEDTDEMVFDVSDAPNQSTYDRITVTAPATAVTDQFIGFRIRISHQDNMTPYGTIDSGEIEDYLIGLECATQKCVPLTTTVIRK